jgi:hypothetical protein
VAGRHAPVGVPPVSAWASRAGAAAVTVLVAQLLWRAVLLRHGYFGQDDFLAMSTAHDGTWSDRLDGEVAGGFAPAVSVLVWLALRAAPLSWGVAATSVLLLEAVAGVLMWLVLTRLLGSRWSRIPVLALFAFASLTLWTTQSWAAGLSFWSGCVLLLAATWALLRVVQDGVARAGALVVVALAVALLVDERAVLDPVVLVGMALVAHRGLTLRERFAATARDQAWVWLGSALVLVGYGVLRWQVAPYSPVPGGQVGEVVTTYLRHGLAEVVGGPWTGDVRGSTHLVPPLWVLVLNGVIVVAAAALTLRPGRPTATLAWATLVAFVLGSVALLPLGARPDGAGTLAGVHQVAAELAPVVALCLAAALGATPTTAPAGARRIPPWMLSEGTAVLAGLVAVVASTAVSTGFLATYADHEADRAYVSHLRADLRRHPQVVLLDSAAPAGIISPAYAERARLSTVAAYAPESPVFDLPSHSLRMARTDGHLARVELEDVVTAVPGDDTACGYPVRSDGTRVPLAAPVDRGRHVLRIGYFTGSDGFLTVGVDADEQRFAVRRGLNVVDVVVGGGFAEFTAVLEQQDATLCLTDATVGIPVAGSS